MSLRTLVSALLVSVTISASPAPTIWQRNFNSAGPIIPTRDGGALILGYVLIATDSTDADLRLTRIDVRGETLWHKDYGGTSVEFGRVGVELPDGGFII